jgi:broad-specificity NMP kinase
LKKRRYGKNKVKENVECEIFDVCLNEAKEKGHKILVIDTTKGIKNPLIFNHLEIKDF